MNDVVPINPPVVGNIDAEQIENKEHGEQGNSCACKVKPIRNDIEHNKSPYKYGYDFDFDPNPFEAVCNVALKQLSVLPEQNGEQQHQNEHNHCCHNQSHIKIYGFHLQLRCADNFVRGVVRGRLCAHRKTDFRRLNATLSQCFQCIRKRICINCTRCITAENTV